MYDFIDRDAAESIFACDLDEKDRKVSYHGFCIDAVIRLSQLPAADVRPVVLCRTCVLHGRCYTEDVFQFAGLDDDERFCGVGRKSGNGSE